MGRPDLYLAVAVNLLSTGTSQPLPPSHLTFLGRVAAHIVDARLIYKSDCCLSHINQNNATGLIDESSLLELLCDDNVGSKSQRDFAKTVLAWSRHVFVHQIDGVFGFTVPSLCTLFAAMYLLDDSTLSPVLLSRSLANIVVENDDRIDTIFGRISERASDPRWRESICLALEIFTMRHGIRRTSYMSPLSTC